MRDYYGEAVEPTPRSEHCWSTVPHFFFDTPGYVYSYAFGQLLALAAYARYQQIGSSYNQQLPRDARRRRLERDDNGSSS